MTHPTFSFSRIPEELLVNIFENLAPPSPTDSALSLRTPTKCSLENTNTLFRLCQTSTQFARIAQPLLVSWAADIITRDEVLRDQIGELSQKRSAPSKIILLLRTLMTRVDLSVNIRGFTLDLSGLPDEHVEQKAITVGYLKRIFGKEEVKRCFRAWVVDNSASRKEYYSFQIQRFPERLLQDIVQAAKQWPMSDTFSKAELQLLIRQAYSIVSDSELNTSISSRLLRAAFEDDKTGVNLLINSLAPRAQNLAILAGDYGTRLAGSTWGRNLETWNLSHQPLDLFSSLRHVKVTHTSLRSYGACLESYLLRVPNLESIEIVPLFCMTQEDLDELEALEKTSLVKHVTIRGPPHNYYLGILLDTFVRLESLAVEIDSPSKYTEDREDSQEDVDTVLAALEQQKKTLQSLKIRCVDWCSQDNMVADFSQMSTLTHIEIDASILHLPKDGHSASLNIPALADRLPPGLESLKISYEPDVEFAFVKCMVRFLKRLTASRGEVTNRNMSWPVLDVTDAENEHCENEYLVNDNTCCWTDPSVEQAFLSLPGSRDSFWTHATTPAFDMHGNSPPVLPNLRCITLERIDESRKTPSLPLQWTNTERQKWWLQKFVQNLKDLHTLCVKTDITLQIEGWCSGAKS
ncbi:hypothetical protein EJ05DRAFT_503332 [Pseudovirgaria hyperparasitica]|uniref:Uncharacterized protein n=1 Tax=Pseudovirgaria hyperparasitica TaxID=470096 RepID=A0A6A6W1V1_9PEZI|nr:uncharacterized protein EJ05DRAFT_503332 [Pseudovirgaria hyperparasitica]KAF2755021.1 hypothetical protein EJ05DRAFT_503332 [Pseudovirgaria hyperparasitica]